MVYKIEKWGSELAGSHITFDSELEALKYENQLYDESCRRIIDSIYDLNNANSVKVMLDILKRTSIKHLVEEKQENPSTSLYKTKY